MLDPSRKLKAKMVLFDINQRDLATRMGVGLSTINRKLNDPKLFTGSEVITLCEILEITDPVEQASIFLANPSQNRDKTSA